MLRHRMGQQRRHEISRDFQIDVSARNAREFPQAGNIANFLTNAAAATIAHDTIMTRRALPRSRCGLCNAQLRAASWCAGRKICISALLGGHIKKTERMGCSV
ncbi:hypothetical protein [Rhodoplanes sp. Z2-YC6860]|uniref:hypothetical protein n=1 Tax=Rhodoplanes sp. Z2-YC6860 TaxID=674703 RepID=UPI0012EDF19D|nr:hypothetical protein [Rhodoplanes sp. Z2-YC6860]